MSAINYSELDYSRPDGTYVYPSWAVGIGWAMAAFGAIWIPIVFVGHILRVGYYHGFAWEVSGFQ